MMQELVQTVGDFPHGFIGGAVTPDLSRSYPATATRGTASFRALFLRYRRDASAKFKASPVFEPGGFSLARDHGHRA